MSDRPGPTASLQLLSRSELEVRSGGGDSLGSRELTPNPPHLSPASWQVGQQGVYLLCTSACWSFKWRETVEIWEEEWETVMGGPGTLG